MVDNPIDVMTRWLTRGSEDENEKTRVLSKEQMNFYLSYRFLGSKSGLGIGFYEDIARIDEQLMMAYKGGRSDDVVAALTRLKEDLDKDVGLQAIKKALGGDKPDRRRNDDD